jgi:hypothetical protein
MSAVRSIFNDLVDRRLWPVALALVAALVAVPVLLAGGSSAPAPDAAAPLANAAPASNPTAQAAISVSTPSTAPQNRPGSVRNPFAQHKSKAAAAPTALTPPPAATGTPYVPSSPGVGLGLPTTPSVTPIVPNTGGGTNTTVTDVWRVDLRFGDAGNQKVRHDIPRLTPLPSATNPFFIFLGVMNDHKTAVFLISSDATATGDGKCTPNATQCDTIEMRAGDTEFFDVAQGNAGVVQYELDLLKVSHGKVRSKAATASAARKVSKGGKLVVQELKAEGDKSMSRYIYSYKRDLLVRRHGRRATASASSMSTGLDAAAHTSSLAGTSWGG